MKRPLAILGVITAILVGVVIGVAAVYALTPRGVLPPPRMPADTAPWYGWLATQPPFSPKDEPRVEPIETLVEKAVEAGGHKQKDPHLDFGGAVLQNGNVHYSGSWVGPTSPKKVLDELNKEVEAFVQGKGGTRKNSGISPLGLGGQNGFLLFWEFEVQGWTGWFNVWIVLGAEDRYTLIITMNPVKISGRE